MPTNQTTQPSATEVTAYYLSKQLLNVVTQTGCLIFSKEWYGVLKITALTTYEIISAQSPLLQGALCMAVVAAVGMAIKEYKQRALPPKEMQDFLVKKIFEHIPEGKRAKFAKLQEVIAMLAAPLVGFITNSSLPVGHYYLITLPFSISGAVARQGTPSEKDAMIVYKTIDTLITPLKYISGALPLVPIITSRSLPLPIVTVATLGSLAMYSAVPILGTAVKMLYDSMPNSTHGGPVQRLSRVLIGSEYMIKELAQDTVIPPYKRNWLIDEDGDNILSPLQRTYASLEQVLNSSKNLCTDLIKAANDNTLGSEEIIKYEKLVADLVKKYADVKNAHGKELLNILKRTPENQERVDDYVSRLKSIFGVKFHDEVSSNFAQLKSLLSEIKAKSIRGRTRCTIMYPRAKVPLGTRSSVLPRCATLLRSSR